MDVNFSQVGQNFAQLEPSQPLPVEIKQGQQLKADAQNDANDPSNNGQENQAQADIELVEQEQSAVVENALGEISEFLQSTNRQLSFSVDENSDRQIVKVMDSSSGEVIRQIPSEEVLALSERIRELQADVGSAVGVLFNKQV